MARVLIVGGGVGGTMVANRLAGSADVTVLNRFADHLNQPAFLYRAFGRRFRYSAPERRLLRPGVRLLIGKAVGLDLDARQVVLEEGSKLPFDFLILSTGSRLMERETPGFMKGAHHFHCRWAADRLWRALQEFGGGRIVVGAWSFPYKCPPAPHEFILLLEDWLRRRRLRRRTSLTFVYPMAGIFSKPAVEKVLRSLFEARGIDVVTEFVPSHVDPSRKKIYAAGGKEQEYDQLVMVPPHQGAPLARSSGLANGGGWIPVDPYSLRAAPRVYVLGDAAGLSVPKSGAAAHYQSDIVASNILMELAGREPVARYDGKVT
jgi:sulfide:quinone oxidoreductase